MNNFEEILNNYKLEQDVNINVSLQTLKTNLVDLLRRYKYQNYKDFCDQVVIAGMMQKGKSIHELSEPLIFLSTLYYECRGEEFIGQTACAQVIMTRALSSRVWWGTSVKDVCLCKNEEDIH